MPKRFSVLFFFCFSFVYSQQKFSKELQFINDNDLYISVYKDRYYTNGMFLSFRYLSTNKKSLEKKINEFEIGHEMYTPKLSTVLQIDEHDRPFAGYLYGSFGQTRVFKSGQILKNQLQIGVLGPEAGGQELQDFIHQIYNFMKAVGWKYQIQSTFALNLNSSYLIPMASSKSNLTDIHNLNELEVGTISNKISSGFYGRFGFKKLQDSKNTISFGTHLNDENTSFVRQVESFIYWKTMLSFVAYDSTLQGSLLNNNSMVTLEPNPFRFDFELGYKFTANHWIFGYSYHFNTAETSAQIMKTNHYATLSFSYLFE